MRHMLLLILCLLLLIVPLQAQDSTPVPDLSPQVIYQRILTIDDLAARQVLTDDEATSQIDYYLQQAADWLEPPVTRESLEDHLAQSTGLPGWLTFVNVIWFIASVLIVVAFAYLFGAYILAFLMSIPVTVYEVLLYLLCLVFILHGREYPPETGQFVAMPGVLGLWFLLPWTYTRHILPRITPPDAPDSDSSPDDETPPSDDSKPEFGRYVPFLLQYLLLTLVWGGLAIWYESSLIGYLAVFALLLTMGFTVVVSPLMIALGFQDRGLVALSMSVTFILVTGYVLLKIAQVESEVLAVFEPGVYLIGTLVYFIGGLIQSSRYFQDSHYLLRQIPMLGGGLLAIFAGLVWDIQQLQGVGGTFLMLYLMEKYVEIINWQKRWAWGMLGLGILLYLIALFINQNPAYFILPV